MKIGHINPASPALDAKPWWTEPPAAFRRTDENELDRLKNRLLRQELATTCGSGAAIALRRAANEAASLAWLEAFPMLVFPDLFSEKAAIALATLTRQHDIRVRSARFLPKAA